MKALRLLLGVVLLLGSCDTIGPTTPPPAVPRPSGGPSLPDPQAAPCDSACAAPRAPMLGGGTG